MLKYLNGLKKNKKSALSVFLLLMTGVSLTGCATQVKPDAPAPSNAPLYALDTVAIETASNIRTLSQMQTASIAKESNGKEWRSFMFNLESVPVALSKKETFDFVGTAEDGIKGIADLAEFSFHVVGKAPAEPLMVSMRS